ncbi:MAG: arylesterase [Terracidiphilus sp.]
MDVRRTLLVSFCLLFVPACAFAAAQPLLICYGDSITAGYGLPYGQSYPADLQHLLNASGYHYQVRNMGSSGATTADALASLPSVLRLRPAVVIVEFGGNDGLRGLPLEQTRRNLDEVLTALQNAHIEILLAGITLPPNYGQAYIDSFDQLFRALAEKHHVALVPMIYKNLIHVPGTIQADGIHPTAKGSAIIARTLLPYLKPMLKSRE